MKTLTLLSLLLVSCNTASVQQPIAVALTTDGGLTGRGLGNLSIDGSRANGTSLGPAACGGELTAEEQRELADAIAKAKPAQWKSDYAPASNPNGYADQIRYTLTVNGHTASWTDESYAALPRDLAFLHEITWRIHSRICK